MIAYKLLRKRRRDGTLGSLFINRGEVLPVGEWLAAQPYRTAGFAYRPGWHAVTRPVAPHLKERLASGEQRAWFKVELDGVQPDRRPESQGGEWLIAERMKILEEVR